MTKRPRRPRDADNGAENEQTSLGAAAASFLRVRDLALQAVLRGDHVPEEEPERERQHAHDNLERRLPKRTNRLYPVRRSTLPLRPSR